MILELRNGVVVLNCWRYMWLMRIYCNVYVLLLEHVMLEMGNGIVIFDLLLYMEGICASMIDGIELRG